MGSPHTAFRESDLVGRDAEMSFLDRSVTAAAGGRGGLILLTGEPGIGKSRLAVEASWLARRRGFRVVWGRCRETEGAPPFWPWTQILRGVLTGSAGQVPGDLRPLLDTGLRVAPGADRFQVFDAAAITLAEHARREPLLLVLDDLHRADHSSDGQRGAMSSISSLLANVAAVGVAALFAYSALENATTRRMRARWGPHLTGVFLRSLGVMFIAATVTGLVAVSVPSRAGTIVFFAVTVLAFVKLLRLLLVVAALLKGQDADARREAQGAPEVRGPGSGQQGQSA